MDRSVRIFRSPEDAERAKHEQYRAMTPNERVALTVELQRHYYEQRTDTPRRLRDFLRLLNGHDVQYLVVGGHAVSFHGYPRFTHDIDVVVLPRKENAERLVTALEEFGFTNVGLGPEDFLRDTTVVLGRAPHEINIMTYIKGVEVDTAWEHRVAGMLDTIPVYFIGKSELLTNKRAVGRPEDLADVARLSKT